MKVVLLAGGLGTRISEESGVRPKPMVEIGGKPIIWHIMKIFSSYGFNEFILACGYKSNVIKDYFSNYTLYNSDVTFDMANHTMELHKNTSEKWKVTLVETGEDSMTGGRIKRVQDYVNNERFFCTYGDGLADVNISALLDFHMKQGTYSTVTAVQPSGRWGAFQLDEKETKIEHFREKPKGDGAWVNGGYMVLEPQVFDYIDGDSTVFEQEPMQKLAHDGQMSAFRHTGFWQPMDTLRDKHVLESLWNSSAPWKVW